MTGSKRLYFPNHFLTGKVLLIRMLFFPGAQVFSYFFLSLTSLSLHMTLVSSEISWDNPRAEITRITQSTWLPLSQDAAAERRDKSEVSSGPDREKKDC